MSKSGKADVYAKELDSARLRGNWLSEQPSQSGKSLPWKELLRKYAKHNPDKSSVSELATVEHELKAAIHNFQVDSEYSDTSHLVDYKTHPSPNDTTLFPPIMRASVNGLGWSTESVSQLADKVLEFGSGSNRPAAVSLRALALFTLGRDEEAVDILHRESFMETAGEVALQPEANNSALAALIIQGFTIYGMANERLLTSKNEPGYAPFALAGYARAIDLHEIMRGGKKANALRGLPADEIERWAEVALYRNALLSIRNGESVQSLHALRSYQAHAGRWIADFRLPQRNVIYRHYLRVLNRSAELGTYADPPELPPKSRDDWRSKAYQLSVVATVASRVQIRDFESERIHRDPSAKRAEPLFSSVRISSRTVSKRRPAAYRDLRPPSPSWSNEMLTAQKMAFAALRKSTEFPKAGHINLAVIDFADEMIKAWQINGEMGGEQADDIVEILYGLVTLTFHSQRIARYLVQLLFAAENPEEAKRALQSYIQIVEKAREAEGTDEQVQKVENTKDEATAGQANGAEKSLPKAPKDTAEDTDDDETFVRTLALGAHCVGRYCNDYVMADKVAEKALAIVEDKSKAPLSSNTVVVARLKRVSAFAKAGLAIAIADPVRRAALQAQALALLTAAVQLDDQSSEAYYQLAYLQAELRDVHSALQSARKAVELEPADVEAWHLLVLLLSAQKKYRDAFKIAEVALAENDPVVDPDDAYRGVNGTPANFTATQLLSVDYPPKPAERGESILRLMLTYNMLEEINDGVENAIAGQREIFSYFHRAFPSAAAAAAAAASSTGDVSSDVRASQDLSDLQRRRSLAQQGTNDTLLARTTSGGRARSYAQNTGTGGSQVKATVGAIGTQFAPADADDGSPTANRYRHNLERQSEQLAKIWLASAASFRRAGLLKDCRSAIQEAERLQPGLAAVWVQLSLYFMDAAQTRLAVDSLYKALACSIQDVAASVHLARLFLANPELKPHADTQIPLPDLKQSASSGDEVSGESRSISTAAPEATQKYKSTAEASLSAVAQDLSAVSLAEGLLTTTTKGAGWDASEAWLFLGKAIQRCNRPQRARECFEYALQLEDTKPIRPLSMAVLR